MRWRNYISAVLAIWLCCGVAGIALAQSGATGEPPYERSLNRLAEILGALHHLRPLCGADEEGLWRDKMKTLIDAEAQANDIRRARLTDSFNRGYRGYRNAYLTCDAVTVRIVEDFMREGNDIASRIAARYGS